MYVEWLKCVSFHLFVPWRLLGTEKDLSAAAVVYDDYGTLIHVTTMIETLTSVT